MRIAVLGSVNLDLVATAPHLPAPGETVTTSTRSAGGATRTYTRRGVCAEAQAAVPSSAPPSASIVR